MAEPKVTIFWDELVEEETRIFGPRLDRAAGHLADALKAAWPRSKETEAKKRDKAERESPRYTVIRRNRGGHKNARVKQPTADRIFWKPSETDHLTRWVVVPFPGGYVEGGWHHIGGKLIPARNIAAEVVAKETDRLIAIIDGE